jgi:hypothetical protein
MISNKTCEILKQIVVGDDDDYDENCDENDDKDGNNYDDSDDDNDNDTFIT